MQLLKWKCAIECQLLTIGKIEVVGRYKGRNTGRRGGSRCRRGGSRGRRGGSRCRRGGSRGRRGGSRGTLLPFPVRGGGGVGVCYTIL